MQAPVCCTALTPDGELALSGAAGDRTLALFSSRVKADRASAQPSSGKVPVRKAKLTLTLPEPPTSIACAACDSEGAAGAPRDCSQAFVAAAVTQGGTACVWRCAREGKAWRGHLRCSIKAHSAQEAVLAVAFASESSTPSALSILALVRLWSPAARLRRA